MLHIYIYIYGFFFSAGPSYGESEVRGESEVKTEIAYTSYSLSQLGLLCSTYIPLESRTAYPQNCDTETCVTWKEKFFLQDQTNTMDHEQVFMLVTMLAFDAVDIFQSNIGTLPQLQMFFEL